MAEETDLNRWTTGWPSTKMPPYDAKRFVANGREYRVSQSVTFERYEAYEVLQVEVGLARTFEQFSDEIKECYNLCNQVASGKHVFADLAVRLRDLMIGVQLVGAHETPAVLKLCTLFINREGEDIRTIDDGIMDQKIHDWREEGIDLRWFFTFALSSIPGYINALKAASPDTSTEEAQEPGARSSSSKDASKRSGTATMSS